VSEIEIPDIVIRRLPLYAREPGLLASEGRDFIRQIVASRTPGPVASELDLLELPGAVLAEL